MIGQNIRRHRKELNMSQAKLGEYADLSTQQIQKYESSKNRVSAATLLKISNILAKDFDDFFVPKSEIADIDDIFVPLTDCDPMLASMAGGAAIDVIKQIQLI